jgi:single-stranded DNA-specific DHH superfamily exonuclease
MFESYQGKGLILHHWDTDGICSARLLLDRLHRKNIENKTPNLGNYFLTKQEIDQYSDFNYIFIVDIALPEENILTIAQKAAVVIFDHHLQKEIKQIIHNNPIIKGEDPDKFPSTSWIVNNYLCNPVNIFALLGIIGDHEQKIQRNKKMYSIIDNFCQENSITFKDMLKMVYLIDANYKIGDKIAVEEAPHLLAGSSAYDILTNKQWNANFIKLNKEITKQMERSFEEVKGILVKRINTPYNIISTITRKIAWESGKNTLVINSGFFKDRDQIYMRGNRNAESMIIRGKELGFQCGGKKEVLGAIVPKEKTEIFVHELISFLSA